jgi:hypothetical protein
VDTLLSRASFAGGLRVLTLDASFGLAAVAECEVRGGQ